jgi:phenylalanyl-tRNA synthetase beta chain
MLFSYNYLRKNLGVKISAKEMVRLMTEQAFEIEEYHEVAAPFTEVYVAQITKLVKHPSADRLRIATVTTKGREYTVVCGAPNIEVGQRVPLAMIGATLPGDVTIAKTKIRDVVSHGMLCSGKELGLSLDHTGIYILPQSAALGRDVALLFGYPDTIIDIKGLPNRPDAYTHVGIARELSALSGEIFTHTTLRKAATGTTGVPKAIVTPDLAPLVRYTLTAIDGVGQSMPADVQGLLCRLGTTPRSGMVDLTNLALRALGAPMHVFDAAKVVGTVTVRYALPGESIILLDDTTIKLHTEDIVIADESGPIALAGIMGGLRTAVTDETINVLLEVASFPAMSIRTTRQRHKLQTDAASYFERGVNPHTVTDNLSVALGWVDEYRLGSVRGMRSAGKVKAFVPLKFTLAQSAITRLLGTKIPMFLVAQYLTRLGFTLQKSTTTGTLKVVVPVARPDVTTIEDVIEEIGRSHGYKEIVPAALPMAYPVTLATLPRRNFLRYLVARGAYETQTYSFVGEKLLEQFRYAPETCIAVESPLSSDLAYLRPSMLPHMLSGMRTLESWVPLVEIGKTWSVRGVVPQELELATVVMAGDDTIVHSALREYLEAYLTTLAIPKSEYEWTVSETKNLSPWVKPGSSADLWYQGRAIAQVALLQPKFAPKEKRLVAVLECDMVWIDELSPRMASYQKPSTYPVVTRDVSLVFPTGTTAADLALTLKNLKLPLVTSVLPKSRYMTPEGLLYIALQLTLTPIHATLTKEEIDGAVAEVMEFLVTKGGARVIPTTL